MKFSICINNYNYGQYLEAAVQSSLNQTMPVSIIVIDDGSDDDSRRILAQFEGHPRIRTVFTPNRGQLSAMIAGLEAAETEYVCFLDADDTMRPEHVSVMAAAFACHPKCDIAWTRHRNSDDFVEPDDALGEGLVGPAAMLTRLTSHKPRTITSCIGVRRSAFTFLNTLPESMLRQWTIRGDDCFLLAGALSGSMRYSSKAVTIDRRVHGSNHFVHNPSSRHAFCKYKHAIATASFIQWACEALAVPLPELALLVKEFRAWPVRNRKTVRCYRKAAKRLPRASRITTRIESWVKIRPRK